jgi:hypothetical protein
MVSVVLFCKFGDQENKATFILYNSNILTISLFCCVNKKPNGYFKNPKKPNGYFKNPKKA